MGNEVVGTLKELNKLREIKKLSKNLIEAIDGNCFEGQDRKRKNDTDIFITHRFIADELEELRNEVKG